MFNQDEFNTLCDRYVIARVAEIRFDWILSKDSPTSWFVPLEITEAAEEAGYDLECMVRQNREVDQGDLRDSLDMLEIVAFALFMVNPSLPDGMRKPGNIQNPLVNWFVTYLTKTAKFWQGKGSQAALVNAAREAVELGSD